MNTGPEKRIAVVLFNLGGPDRLEAVRPFLRNLFSDRAILSVPNPLRWFLARLISSRRAPLARDIYRQIGGRSPLLEQSEDQAERLASALEGMGSVRCFVCMRYWHPFAAETAQAVKAFDPDEIVLLPLYPQFSTTTTGSSMANWDAAARHAGIRASTRRLCCYPTEDAFIQAHIEAITEPLNRAMDAGPTRILFSAHGLPQRVVDRGDPYQFQIEATVAAVMDGLDARVTGNLPGHVICYQSRVGPLKWLQPDTESELRRAGAEELNVVLVPIAFVSEHSETLVELDIEYRAVAKDAGVGVYERVPALASRPAYIDSLARLVQRALTSDRPCSHTGDRICPERFKCCYLETR